MASSATEIRIPLPGTLREAAGGWWVVTIPKGWIVLTRAEVKAGLLRGKALKRHLAFEARQPTDEQ